MRWTAVLCALLLMGCAVEDEPEAVELPGDYAEVIGSETDCERLQEIFDTADGMDASNEKVAILKATDERMAEVGCYD